MLHESEKRLLHKLDHHIQNKVEHTENYQLGFLRNLVLRQEREISQLQARLDKEPATDVAGLGFDYDDLLISAAVYYMGRCTAAAGTFAKQLATNWPQLSRHAQRTIRYILTDAFSRDDFARKLRKDNQDPSQAGLPLGWDCDRDCWEQVRQAWLEQAATGPALVAKTLLEFEGVKGVAADAGTVHRASGFAPAGDMPLC